MLIRKKTKKLIDKIYKCLTKNKIIVIIIILIGISSGLKSCMPSKDNRMVEELIASIENRNQNEEFTITPEDKIAYRTIVAQIYGELQPKARIRISDKIPTLTGDSSHSVDISIRSTEAEQEILTIVNVYLNLKPINEIDLLNFSKILSDIGASKGVMVSNSGFTSSAKSLAPTLGIDLSSVQDAQSRKWSEDIKIPVIMIERRVELYNDFAVYLNAGDQIYSDFKKWQFSTDGGGTNLPFLKNFVHGGTKILSLTILNTLK
ncbi:hypothetical protein KY366_06065 [Candidatus Woesearchaeota archaeon]|nr:hypothetical protein [Candidatus Woesearchaeota archaeon]